MRINLSARKKQILNYLNRISNLPAQSIIEFLSDNNIDNISRSTLTRDIDDLIDADLVSKNGQGPSTTYSTTVKAKLLTYIEPKEYFQEDQDNRNASKHFNWQIFDLLNDFELFDIQESKKLSDLHAEYKNQKSNLSKTIIHKEIERVTIELSWKSSAIEGNTYSLLETENLIKNNQPAPSKTHIETDMILNHKSAIEFIFRNAVDFKQIKLKDIDIIHSLLVEDLNITKGIRKTLVGITGTNFTPLDNEHEIKEALEKMVDLINKIQDPFSKSMLAMLLISYIQPFEDGNKRTSRILGNAILLAHDIFPLSFRSVNEVEYKEAVLLFYEQNNISFFKQLFLDQSEFAVKNYFRSKI